MSCVHSFSKRSAMSVDTLAKLMLIFCVGCCGSVGALREPSPFTVGLHFLFLPCACLLQLKGLDSQIPVMFHDVWLRLPQAEQ